MPLWVSKWRPALSLSARKLLKIRIINWNINGINTHELPLFELISKIKPDIIVLTETRQDACTVV